MRKLLILLFSAAVIAFSISGCGGGSGSDPLGTDSITFTGAASQVNSNGTVVLTATVKNASGAAVVGRDITFGFVSNASRATLTSYSANTNGAGEATTLYRAGATAGSDVVRASISNGAYMDVSITVGGGGGTATGADSISSLSASPSTMSGGRLSVITANVHSGVPLGGGISNQIITFTIPVNNSGASFIDSSGASVSTITIPIQLDSASNTDISATYRAGTNVSGTEVEDMVRATLGNGSTSSIIITRTAATTGTYAVSISPSPAIVTAGQVSIITATVAPAAGGITVTFTMPVNQSLATLSSATATTDGSGKAVVIYQPGTTNPDTTVQDTVQAAVGTATDVKAITRTGSSTLDYRIAVIAAPTTLSLANMNSVVTATVTNNVGTAVSAVTVTFARDVSSVVLGTVLPLTSITDGSGRAQTVYTGVGGVALATGVVKASITIGGNTYTAAVIITNP